MRMLHWLFTGVLVLGTVSPSWGQSWHRYRWGYNPARPNTYAPQTYDYPPITYPDPDAPPRVARPPAPLPPAPQQDDTRRLWVYGDRGENSFRQLPDGTWVESNASGRYRFREVRRTPEFVDLFDPSRNIFARLTDGMMFNHRVGDPTWHAGYRGGWE